MYDQYGVALADLVYVGCSVAYWQCIGSTRDEINDPNVKSSYRPQCSVHRTDHLINFARQMLTVFDVLAGVRFTLFPLLSYPTGQAIP